MGQTSNLRLSDVRAIFRLIGECRELSIDSTLCRRHMLIELSLLTGGQVAMGGATGLRDKFSQTSRRSGLGWAARSRSFFTVLAGPDAFNGSGSHGSWQHFPRRSTRSRAAGVSEPMIQPGTTASRFASTSAAPAQTMGCPEE